MICILVVIQLATGILSESNNEIKKLAGVEDKYCERFSMPQNDYMGDPEEVYKILKKTADKNHVNIIRTLLTDGENGNYEVVKFIYLSQESNYFKNFKVAGKDFEENDKRINDSEDYLSSKDTFDKHQIGKINMHMYRMTLTIRSLNQQGSYFKTSGLYFMELTNGGTKKQFLKDLKQNLEKYFHINLEEQDFEADVESMQLPYTDSDFFVVIEMITLFLIILCCVYYYFKESKQIAVYNLFGISEKKTTFLLQKSFYAVYMISEAVGMAAVFIYSKDIFYVWNVIWKSLLLFVVLFGLLYMLGIVFQHKMNIHGALAGKSSTKYILCINYMAKVVCMIAILYIGGSIYSEYKACVHIKNGYKQWENAEEYGVFYPYYTGYDLTEKENCDAEAAISNELYPKLNENGALYVDSRHFEPEYLEVNGGRMVFEAMTVNPNYLKEFSVFDEQGEKISVAEKETDWVLIVPKALKQKKEEILEYFYEDRKGSYEVAEETYDEKIEEKVKNQKIKIIWSQANQKIFSFNPYVYPDDNNMIENPIIQVMTINNSCILDKYCVHGMGAKDPLKVKMSVDGKNTYKMWKKTLVDLQLDDNLKHIISINEEISQKLNGIYANIRLSVLLLFILLFVWILNSLQSTAILFDKNKKDFVVKRISGWSWKKVYGKYLCREFVIMVLLTLGLAILNPIEKLSRYYYPCAAFVLVFIEVTVFYICMKYYEKQKIVEVLKGE